MELIKEYGENTWAKIFFLVTGLPMSVLFFWAIFNGETLFIKLLSAAMSPVFLYAAVNPFVHKIILGNGFIAEKSLFRKRQILIANITHISVQNNFAQIKSAREKIHIPRFMIKDSDKILGTIISKVKDNERVLYSGDAIVFQSYINEFSGKKALVNNNESGLPSFALVESAELVERKWLYRVVKLTTSRGVFKITYFGKGMGYECVFVNDELVSKKDSHLWYVPKFDFTVEGMRVSVNIRFYPWFTIRKFWIEINDRVVYSE